MRVMQAFRFELDPNRAERVALAQHVGAARFAYNWGLSRCLEALELRHIRRDFLHKVTTWLAKTKPVVVVEGMGVQSLGRGTHWRGTFWRRTLSRSVADAGWGTFRRMLEYKTRWYGSQLIVAPRNFPSTRRCSRCGTVGPRLPLSRRVFCCAACGLTLDRDLNAALNLRLYGLAVLSGSTGSSPGSYACGDPSGSGTAFGPVYEPRVEEAGSGRSSEPPFEVK